VAAAIPLVRARVAEAVGSAQAAPV
jgi:hypothetical protein